MIESQPSSSPVARPPDDSPRAESMAARQRPRWMGYLLAVILTAATLLVRLALGFEIGDPPTLILFTFPIMICAYVGGIGPGLLATALTTVVTNYVLMAPQFAFSLTLRLNLIQSGGLLAAGIIDKCQLDL